MISEETADEFSLNQWRSNNWKKVYKERQIWCSYKNHWLYLVINLIPRSTRKHVGKTAAVCRLIGINLPSISFDLYSLNVLPRSNLPQPRWRKYYRPERKGVTDNANTWIRNFPESDLDSDQTDSEFSSTSRPPLAKSSAKLTFGRSKSDKLFEARIAHLKSKLFINRRPNPKFNNT